MKRLSFFLALVLTLSLATGSAFSQCQLLIDNITNQYDATTLKAGKSHVATIRVQSLCRTSEEYFNLTNGIKVYSPDGANFGAVEANFISPAWDDLNWTKQFINYFQHTDPLGLPASAFTPATAPVAWTGGAVACAFAGVSFGPPDGLPGGLDANLFQINFSSQKADDGLTICIDSTFTPPGGTWSWAGLGVAGQKPDWYQAPQCYSLFLVPNEPPEFDACPGTYSFSHCAVGTIDFNATDPTPPEEGGPDAITYEIVSGPGSIDPGTGVWTWTGPSVPQSGFATLVVQAVDYGGSGGPGDPCTVEIEVTNAPPTVTCPGGVVTISTGDTKGQTVTTGDDCDPLTITAITTVGADPGDVVNVVGNTINYTPAGDARAVTMRVEVFDGEEMAFCEIYWDVITTAPYIVVIEKEEGPTGDGALQGHFTNVSVTLTSILPDQGLGGFDLLMAYDQTALSFQEAVPGTLYDECGWEYFNYRFGADGNCGNGCPSGLVRVIGMAETNNGPFHPGCAPSYVNGLPTTLFDLVFLVSNDRTLECMYAPVRFFWIDCGDNTLSNAMGTELYVSSKVFDFDNAVPVNNGTVGFPTYQGAQDFCLEGDKGEAIRNVDFFNGGVDIICADDIDARGDVNANGLAYEIADAVMFTNYFVSGIGAFVDHYEASVAASDANADGIPLTVADLVYLIRVVVGDALPYPKTNPMVATHTFDNGVVSINEEMGAAHLVFSGTGEAKLLAEGMEMEQGVVEGNLHVIVYSYEANQTFQGAVVSAEGDLLEADFATYEGQPVTSKLVPGSFALEQNYPNPFNPGTNVKFALPGGGDYKLVFYNTIGQTVKVIEGTTQGFETVYVDMSEHASGIYFYKLITDQGTLTKKAVLLK